MMIQSPSFKAPVAIDDLKNLSGLRIHVIGPMKILDLEGNIIEIQNKRARAVLGCLCLNPGERVARSRLAGLLWDRSPEQQARASLRQALYDLGAAIERQAPDVLLVDREYICLRPDYCWIDAASLLNPTADSRDEQRELLTPPAERLLEDFDGLSTAFDQFLQGERTRLHNTLKRSLELQLDAATAAGKTAAETAGVARKLIMIEPTHEGAARALMRAFVSLGDRAQAIREFERFRRTLRLMLDIEPSRETYALYEATRALQTRGASGKLITAASATQAPLSNDDGPARGSFGREGPDHSRALDRISIAVLPFHSSSEEARSSQIVNGIVDEIVGCLSRITGFFVISRMSTSSFAGQIRQPQEIGAALGVRYILSGSASFASYRSRFTVELTDSHTGQVLFSRRYDESARDIFELQDIVSYDVVRRIALLLREQELKQIRTKRPEHFEAYDYLLRGIGSMQNSSPAVYETARASFEAAIAMDPQYAAAYAWLAYWYVLRVGQGWSPDPVADAEMADRAAYQAYDCDSTDSLALAVHGHIAAYLYKDFTLAFQRFDRALATNANSAPAWLWAAGAHAWMGDGKLAIEKVERAIMLSPYDPLAYAFSGIAGMAYLIDGQLDRTIEFGLRCIQQNRTYTHAYRLLVFAHSLAGKTEQAKTAARQLLELEPTLTVERFRQRYPGSAYSNCELLCQALERAEIPVK
jgi:DNA-binding SARP family transcriptional activator/TolB-like protein